MSENKYASPEPVEEAFVLDEKYRRNAKSLRAAAWGLWLCCVPATVFGVLIYILAGLGMENRITPLGTLHWLTALARVGFFLSLGVGTLLCMACGRQTAPFGRLLIAGAFGCVAVPFGLLIMYHFGDDPILNWIFLGPILWSVFLWQLARTLKIRYVGVWIGLSLTFWIVAGAIHHGGLLWPFPMTYQTSQFWGAAFTLAGAVTGVISMWLLRRAILRGLRGM